MVGYVLGNKTFSNSLIIFKYKYIQFRSSGGCIKRLLGSLMFQILMFPLCLVFWLQSQSWLEWNTGGWWGLPIRCSSAWAFSFFLS